MIVVVTVVEVTIAKVIFLVFYSDDNNSNGKVNKRRTIYGKARRQWIGDGELCRMRSIM